MQYQIVDILSITITSVYHQQEVKTKTEHNGNMMIILSIVISVLLLLIIIGHYLYNKYINKDIIVEELKCIKKKNEC
jgi:ATP/ADP translocase